MLEKVPVKSASPNLDTTPGMVDGKEERFWDIIQMIKRWGSERMMTVNGRWRRV